jgi:hypothetical protein
MSQFDVTIVEVLVHRTSIEAASLHEANELARELWDENGPESFTTETLGRTDLIIADEEVSS